MNNPSVLEIGIESRIDLQLVLVTLQNSYIVNAPNKSLYTIGIVRGTAASYTKCSNNDIVTLIFIALDQLGPAPSCTTFPRSEYLYVS